MKCFHFSNAGGDHREDDDSVTSKASKLSWARSLSVASSTLGSRRSEFDSDSKDFSDSVEFHKFLSQKRANDLRVFSFSELKLATRGFSRALLIGEGGFGCVYKGVVRVPNEHANDGSLSDMDVAIKQLNRNGPQGHREWINEVNLLGVIKHPNLVKLVGYCAEDDERGIQRLLVYELMRNKSLEDHLLGRVPSTLTWISRLKIAQDAARGLGYLHEEMDFQKDTRSIYMSSIGKTIKVIHTSPQLCYLELIFRDFKTSNVLLDEDFNAKLSDFGLARQGPSEGFGHVSTSVVGTVGYAAPEYVHTGKLTAKSDVWSFGVVLYELISGRRAVERNLPRNEQKLLEWARHYVSDPRKFHLLVDPRLEGEYCIKSAQKLATLANKCLMKHPKCRPKMSEVVEILGSIIDGTISEFQCSLQAAVSEEEEKEEKLSEEDTESGTAKQGNNYLKKVLDFREMMSLRNKSIRRLDWKNWAPGLVRTW